MTPLACMGGVKKPCVFEVYIPQGSFFGIVYANCNESILTFTMHWFANWDLLKIC